VTQNEHQSVWASLGVRTDIPHPARVYDYILGGKDNFAADREMAEVGLQHMPEMRVSSLENRAFLVRAVRFLREAGIRQFFDIGTGLPTSPNTYEVAQDGHPNARVVYVDNDRYSEVHACFHAQEQCSQSAWFGVHSRSTAIDSRVKQPVTICTKCGARL
jgi:hypothetical protein